MGFLVYNEGEAGGGFEPLPEQEYECIFSEVKVGTSGAGNPSIKVVLTIRSDVEQEGQKRKIFDNLTVTENAMFKFHQLSKALGFEDGREFETLEEYAEAILYQPVRVKSRNDDFNGKITPKVNYYKLSAVGGGDGTSLVNNLTGRQTSDPFADDGMPIDISDDDLPL